MNVFERETRDQEREGVVGGPANAKGDKVADGYTTFFLRCVIVFLLFVMLLFLPKLLLACMAAHTLKNETYVETRNEMQTKTLKFSFL